MLWADLNGAVRGCTVAGIADQAASVVDSLAFRAVVAGARSATEAGGTSPPPTQPGVVLAVPTRDLSGELNGVLMTTLPFRELEAALAPFASNDGQPMLLVTAKGEPVVGHGASMSDIVGLVLGQSSGRGIVTVPADDRDEAPDRVVAFVAGRPRTS